MSEASSHRGVTEPLLRVGEVADQLGVSVQTVKRYERAGRIEPIRLSPRTVRYRPDAVRALLAADSHEGE